MANKKGGNQTEAVQMNGQKQAEAKKGANEKVEKKIGYVKWFNGQKGYGFITPHEDGSEDLFVQQNYIRPSESGSRVLVDGERVEFVQGIGIDGKPMAVNVTSLRRPQHSRNSSGSGEGICYNCKEAGHMARNCSQACYKCNEYGHMPKDCRNAGCYTCGDPGHYSRECRAVQ